MNEFIAQLLSAGAGGGIVGGIVYLMIANYLNGRDAEREKLATDLEKLSQTLETLKNERVAKLEYKFENHIDKDRTQEILTTVQSISSRQSIIDARLTNQGESLAKLAACDEAKALYLDNLNKSFREHFKENHT